MTPLYISIYLYIGNLVNNDSGHACTSFTIKDAYFFYVLFIICNTYTINIFGIENGCGIAISISYSLTNGEFILFRSHERPHKFIDLDKFTCKHMHGLHGEGTRALGNSRNHNLVSCSRVVHALYVLDSH